MSTKLYGPSALGKEVKVSAEGVQDVLEYQDVSHEYVFKDPRREDLLNGKRYLATMASHKKEVERAIELDSAGVRDDTEVLTWPSSRTALAYKMQRDIGQIIHFFGKHLTVDRLIVVQRKVYDSTLVEAKHGSAAQTRGVALTYEPMTVVYTGCVRNVADASCQPWWFSVVSDSRRRFQMLVEVAVKVFGAWQYAHFDNYDMFDAGNMYIGSVNPEREVLLSIVLSALVTRGVTPHFPCFYGQCMVKDVDMRSHEVHDKRALILEQATVSLKTFLERMFFVHDAPSRVVHMETVLLQVLHGLVAASQHYNFKHMDLHVGNVMMSHAADVPYCYKVRGVTYAVQTQGMCWKIMDFGMSTSGVLFKPNESVHTLLAFPNTLKPVAFRAAHVESVNPISGLTRTRVVEEPTPYAFELMDFVRLVVHMKALMPEDADPERDLLAQILHACEAVSLEYERLAGSAYGVFLFAIDSPTGPVPTREQMQDYARPHGVLARLFEVLASRFRCDEDTAARCHAVFDVDTAPFRRTSDLGVHAARYFKIDEDGSLQQLPVVSNAYDVMRKSVPVARRRREAKEHNHHDDVKNDDKENQAHGGRARRRRRAAIPA
jgi:hypothetical protein